MCTRCGEVNQVPLSNARKHTGTVVKVTKELAAMTSEFAKEQYAASRAVPITFHCQHCNEVLPNPNAEPPAYGEDEKQDAITGDQLLQVVCTQCSRNTEIPSTVAADKLRAGRFLASRGTSKVNYSSRKQPHVDCPKCKSALKLTENAKSKVLMPYVTDLGSSKYGIKCPKCSREFAAAVSTNP
jgi:hypothetical protein